ncbi:MAG TPA: hypothetical protein VMD59_12600 [Acidimicrobiales bacterium]|nr:hypothetical protein [Acidimicrobiales bacterium]
MRTRRPTMKERLASLEEPYVQAPSGWWTDVNGVQQPPGSYLDPELRVTADGSPASASPQSLAERGRALLRSLIHPV